MKSECNSSSSIVFKELPEHDPLRRSANISRIRRIGWDQRVPLQEGIRRTIKYYEDQVNHSDNLDNFYYDGMLKRPE